MAVSSYRVQNDYTPFTSLKPYELPVNEIFKSLVANTQYWQQGAMRVKSAYDNALGLDLSLEENKERSKEYFKKVDEQMKKLSGSDLANVDVQNQALKLFNPLLEDKYILQDHQNTSLYKKALSDYQSDPNKNQANLDYATDWYNDWTKDPDANNKSKDYVSKAKSYIKYYDYAKEFKDIVKDCHSSQTSDSGPMTDKKNQPIGYLYQTNTKSLDKSKLEACLSSSLSSQALQQISIEGYSKWKRQDGSRDLAALGRDYLNQGVDLELASKISSLKGVKKGYEALKDGNDYSDLIKSYDNQIRSYESQLESYNTKKSKIEEGDMSFIDKNYDVLSGQTFSNSLLSRFANSHSWSETTKHVSSDATFIAMAANKQKELDRRSEENRFLLTQNYNYAKLNQEKDIALLKEGLATYDADTGKIVPMTNANNPNDILNYVTDEKLAVDNSFAKVEADITSRESRVSSLYKTLNDYIKTQFKVGNDSYDPSNFDSKQRVDLEEAIDGQGNDEEEIVNFINIISGNKESNPTLFNMINDLKKATESYNTAVQLKNSILGENKIKVVKSNWLGLNDENTIYSIKRKMRMDEIDPTNMSNDEILTKYGDKYGLRFNEYYDENGKKVDKGEIDKLFQSTINVQDQVLRLAGSKDFIPSQLKIAQLVGIDPKSSDELSLITPIRRYLDGTLEVRIDKSEKKDVYGGKSGKDLEKVLGKQYPQSTYGEKGSYTFKIPGFYSAISKIDIDFKQDIVNLNTILKNNKAGYEHIVTGVNGKDYKISANFNNGAIYNYNLKRSVTAEEKAKKGLTEMWENVKLDFASSQSLEEIYTRIKRGSR